MVLGVPIFQHIWLHSCLSISNIYCIQMDCMSHMKGKQLFYFQFLHPFKMGDILKEIIFYTRRIILQLKIRLLLGRGLSLNEGNRKSQMLSPFKKWWQKHCCVPLSLKGFLYFVKLWYVYRAYSLVIWALTQENQQSGMCAKRRHRSAWASTQSNQSLPCALKG